MAFSIRMGVPEMLALWNRLYQANIDDSISKTDAGLYKKWSKAPFLQSVLSQPQHARNS